MCTLTWSAIHEGGYELFFNRDELNTRGAEQPPRLEACGGVEFAAPRDADRGGTWLLANAHGVTVALLNDYASGWRPPTGSVVSRGAVVLACASAANAQAAVDLVGAMPLANVGAFRLVVIGGDGIARRLHWAGETLMEEPDGMLAFETSSSFQTEAVCAARRLRFEDLLDGREQATREELEAFHMTHDALNGATSVLMRRTDARTRSVSRVSVRGMQVEMHYQPVDEKGELVGSQEARVHFDRL